MEIICKNCQSKFRIADEKIPANRVATLPCPKCKHKISVGPRDAQASIFGSEFDMDAYDANDKPFDFVEEEGNTALICESDVGVSKKIVKILDLMEYHITVAENGRDALKKMRYHQYDLILINETFYSDNPETNMVLLYIERMSMSLRRNIFVAMLSNNFRTQDNMTAFKYSVNTIINLNNIDEFDKILQGGLADHEFFFRVYVDILKKEGRI